MAKNQSKIIRTVCWVIITCVVIFGAKLLGRQVGQQRAIDDFQQECKIQNAPTGFTDALWLQTKSQVKAISPDIVEFSPNDLKADSTALGRPAFIDFIFRDNLLVMTIVTFKGEKSESIYRLTHLLATKEYGDFFPEPKKTDEFILISKKYVGQTSIEHNLWWNKGLGIPIEQIIFCKVK